MNIALTLLIALFARGAVAVPIADPHPCAQQCEIQRFLDQNIGIHLDRPLTLAELRKFAHVLSETTSKTGAGALSDTIHEIKYSGLVVRVEVTAENSLLVQTIDLTGGPYRMPFGIKLGKIEGPHDIDFVLGQPSQTKRDAGKPIKWIYHNLEGTAQVSFERQDDAIVAVHWDYSAGD